MKRLTFFESENSEPKQSERTEKILSVKNSESAESTDNYLQDQKVID